MKWEELPFRERAEYIKVGVKNGLKSLEEVKNAYHKFEDGGQTTLPGVKTIDGFDVKMVNGIPFVLRNDDKQHIIDENKAIADKITTSTNLSKIKEDYLDRLSKRHSKEIVDKARTIWEEIPVRGDVTSFNSIGEHDSTTNNIGISRPLLENNEIPIESVFPHEMSHAVDFNLFRQTPIYDIGNTIDTSSLTPKTAKILGFTQEKKPWGVQYKSPQNAIDYTATPGINNAVDLDESDLKAGYPEEMTAKFKSNPEERRAVNTGVRATIMNENNLFGENFNNFMNGLSLDELQELYTKTAPSSGYLSKDFKFKNQEQADKWRNAIINVAYNNPLQDTMITPYNSITDEVNYAAYGGHIYDGTTEKTQQMYTRGNNNPIAFDKEGNLVDQVTGEKGVMLLPEFTVKGIDPKKQVERYKLSKDYMSLLQRQNDRENLWYSQYHMSPEQWTNLPLSMRDKPLEISSLPEEILAGIITGGGSKALDYVANKMAKARPIGILNNLINYKSHIYANKSPYDYNLDELPNIWKSIMSGKPANTDNPTWLFDDMARYASEQYLTVANRLHSIPSKETLENAMLARADAWRMRLGLGQKYNSWQPNPMELGTYTNEKGIKNLQELVINNGKNIDFVTGAGGNVGNITKDFLGQGMGRAKDYGVATIKDVWDLHPFSRTGDRLIDRVSRLSNKKISKVKKKIHKTAENFLYDNKAIDDWIKTASEFDLEQFGPDWFPSSGIKRRIGEALENFNDKIKYTNNDTFKFLKGLDEKLANKDAVELIGGEKPFTIRYDIPFTTVRSNDITEPNRMIKGFLQDDNLPTEAYRFKKNFPYLDFSIDKNALNFAYGGNLYGPGGNLSFLKCFTDYESI